ncbi:MAG: RNA polymerase sigma factor [Saprospiraceae bacterium]
MNQEIKHIIEVHQDKIYKTCLGFTGNSEEAKDLLQEVCINLWLGLEKFRKDAKIATWIYRVTVNTCLMYQRKKKVDIIALSAIQELPIKEPQEASTDKKVELLQQFISALPEKERIIIILYLENLSYEEIADVTGISTNYIGVKINRIKKLLTKKFNNHKK